ncbi:MAG TPA: winged helix-turn-helix domain-containing protein [Woeseiaceae bacterium]|nr:winged helix-turn-helix domain-containing protein [Woeseiaceae bacterium]
MPTYDELRKGFGLGGWQVLPDRGLLQDGDAQVHVEPLPMDVLVALAAHQGDVVSKDQLVDIVWKGRPVSDEVITRCISLIRRALGDDAKSPTFVENVPRRGYRLMLPITLPERPDTEAKTAPVAVRSAYALPLIGGFVAITLVVAFSLWPWPKPDSGNQPIRSVVVFPFRCDVDKEYLCFGFSEVLTSTLFHLDELRVVKSREAFVPVKSTREIVDEFEVDAIIEGQVRYDGLHFTVVADLIDARNGKVLFSNTYDGAEETIYDLQGQVAADVRRRITGETDTAAPVTSRPAGFAVFDRYAEGLYAFEKRSADSIREAIELFRQTIELDPKFGTAYLMLAYAYALLPEYADEPQEPMYERAMLTAEQGMRMDPSISDATATIRAFIAHQHGDWIGAENAYRQALGADYVYPITHHLYSRLLSSVGRLDASLAEALRARELDPQSAVLISRLAIANFWVGNMDEAERLFARAHGMNLLSPIHDLAYALFRIRQGRTDEARELAKAGLQKYAADNRWVDPVFDGFEDPEKRELAHQLVSDLAAKGQLPARVEITLWALLNDADRAMLVARRLETEGEVFEAELLFIPQFELLRNHPDFAALMDDIGLTEYWNSVGCRWLEGAVHCDAAASN